LTFEQIEDDGFELGAFSVSFRPDPSGSAEIVLHEVNILIVAAWHDRGRPIGLTHYQELHATEPGFKRHGRDSFLDGRTTAAIKRPHSDGFTWMPVDETLAGFLPKRSDPSWGRKRPGAASFQLQGPF
jgi:hypothetical protein